jgi:DNA invertase Pin-like site-specific DNA recombinase
MIVFYARVSTTEQTTAHQCTQAEQAGFKIDKVVADEGISGVSTRLAERPEGKRLLDMLRAGDTLVVRWVDRLGVTTPTWWTRSGSSCAAESSSRRSSTG